MDDQQQIMDLDEYNFTADERAKATELLGELGLEMNVDGVFLVFAGTPDTDRKLYYPLHNIGSEQIADVAQVLHQISKELRSMELLGGDGSGELATAPTSILIN